MVRVTFLFFPTISLCLLIRLATASDLCAFRWPDGHVLAQQRSSQMQQVNENGYTCFSHRMQLRKAVHDFIFDGCSDDHNCNNTAVRKYGWPMGSWCVSNVEHMHQLFCPPPRPGMMTPSWEAFNDDISSWDVSNVTLMSEMFKCASSFNGDVSSWNVSSVTMMERMFEGALAFNGNLSAWDVSSVTNMNGMFDGASSFNGDISSWNVSSVTRTERMFQGAAAFNGDLSSWDVSSVIRMDQMFNGASTFNADLSLWNVSSVTWMYAMFQNASSFNQDLSSWDTSSVTWMTDMFNGASSFNQDLSSWDVSNVTGAERMFEGAAFDSTVVCNWSDAWNELICPKSAVLYNFSTTESIHGFFGIMAICVFFAYNNQGLRFLGREVQKILTMRRQQQRESRSISQALAKEERHRANYEQFITKFHFQTVLPDKSNITTYSFRDFAFKADEAGNDNDDEIDASEVGGNEDPMNQGLLRWSRPSAKDKCCICLECYAVGETICAPIATGCNHVFHEGCINEWLNKNDRCPLCRVELRIRLYH